MTRIELLGIDGAALTGEQSNRIRGCVAAAVSRRHRPLVEGLCDRLLEITPLARMFAQVEEELTRGDVAVLASGDPLLFGIGRSLIERFGSARIIVHPALSSVQLACARFRLPWDDLALVSLHGRPEPDIAGRVLRHDRVLLFTGGGTSPDSVARELLATLGEFADGERIQAIRVRVAENLGLASERLFAGTLAETAACSFAPLNLMLVEQPAILRPFRLGLTEDEIVHSRGLITKDEVRAATLHRLRLPAAGVFWDIGGGSGSISLEAARLCPELRIHTVEKHPEGQANIRANVRRFGAYTIRLTAGEAPEALSALPDPDRVFVGGSGQRLEAILEASVARLIPGGRIVVNGVLPETEATAIKGLGELGLRTTSSTIAVTRRAHHSGEERMFNPITLITGDL